MLYEKIQAIIHGFLTRKYKRDFPLDQYCSECNKHIKGKIHREEAPDIEDKKLIMYHSDYNDDKGISSFSYRLISTAYKINNNYCCSQCLNKTDPNKKCSICISPIKNKISTKCGHSFCSKCLLAWVKVDNSKKTVFNATCPLCRKTI
jgi:hypothetical protein